ncbi:MAG: DUF5036 family protein [Prevotella sp.]|nr:DUF5036 family protein [Prevotella sp.]
MVLIAAFVLASCGGDDDGPDGPSTNTSTDRSGDGSGSTTINPNDDVPDPEGTISFSMRNQNNGNTYLDGFMHIDGADNFAGGQFVSLGAMHGLGNVATIPVAGWANNVSVIPGNGYVAYNENTNTYYRIYVKSYTVNTLSEVIGAEVKYQRPFKGVDEELKPEQTTVMCTKTDAQGNFEMQTIQMLNTSIVPYEVTSSADWCGARPYLNELHIFPGKAASSEAEEATLTLKTLYGKETTIKVIRSMEPTAIIGGETTWRVGNYSSNGKVPFSTNVSSSDLIAEANVSWITNVGISHLYDNNYSLYFAINGNYSNERTGMVDIKSKAGKVLATLTIVQEAGDVSNAFSQSKVGFDKNGGSVSINCNLNAEEEKATSSASWCSFTQNGSTLTIRATATTTDRKATITFPASGLTLSVVQAKYQVGDSFNENGVSGTVGSIDEKGKRFVYQYVGTAQWSTENVEIGAKDQEDGLKNLAVVKKIANYETIYPAFGLCTALGSGWYLPAQNEAVALSRILGLGWNVWVWSSTEMWDNSSFGATEDWGSNRAKSDYHQVYAIHQF